MSQRVTWSPAGEQTTRGGGSACPSVGEKGRWRNSSSSVWRRGWDSNPRSSYPDYGFRDRPIRPLSHLSPRPKGLAVSHSWTIVRKAFLDSVRALIWIQRAAGVCSTTVWLRERWRHPAGASFMTMSVTCVVPQVEHVHSVPSPWRFVNRRTKVMGFSQTLQEGGVFVMITSLPSLTNPMSRVLLTAWAKS